MPSSVSVALNVASVLCPCSDRTENGFIPSVSVTKGKYSISHDMCESQRRQCHCLRNQVKENEVEGRKRCSTDNMWAGVEMVEGDLYQGKIQTWNFLC